MCIPFPSLVGPPTSRTHASASPLSLPSPLGEGEEWGGVRRPQRERERENQVHKKHRQLRTGRRRSWRQQAGKAVVLQ